MNGLDTCAKGRRLLAGISGLAVGPLAKQLALVSLQQRAAAPIVDRRWAPLALQEHAAILWPSECSGSSPQNAVSPQPGIDASLPQHGRTLLDRVAIGAQFAQMLERARQRRSF